MKDIIDILKAWDEEHNAREYELRKQAKNTSEPNFTETDLYVDLCKTLDEKEKTLLDTFILHQLNKWSNQADVFYKLGFKTGFKLAIEMSE